jgi:hypothetical protein
MVETSVLLSGMLQVLYLIMDVKFQLKQRLVVQEEVEVLIV